MKKNLLMGIGWAFAFSISPHLANAQIPIADIIKEGIKKVIKAVDLEVQRLQNQTIWLQNAQKTLENTMSKLKLDEITDWVQKQKDLYANYFDELWKVKQAIATYHRVKEIIDLQIRIVNDYKLAYGLFKQDGNFSSDEISYMSKVYSGILDESLKNLDQIYLVINAFATQMSDAKRLEIINNAATAIQENWTDLNQFNNQNKLLSLRRAAEKGEIDVTKKLYGIQ